jgi:ABC-type transporter Mla subunit MlaD
MSPKEQQKMLLEEADKRETENINKTVDDAKKQIDELKKKIEDAVKAHDSNSLLYYGSSLEAAEELLRLKEAEKKKNDELAEQVRFQSLSNEDKKKELQAQIDLIQQQIDETEKLIPESARVADSIENFVTPAIENTQKGIFDVNTEWGKFDLQTQNNIAKVNFLNGKLVETKNIMLAIDDANQNGLTYAQAISKAKEEYDSANKYLNDIKKNGDKYSDDAYKKAVEDLEKKKKSYQELGGEINIPKSDGAGIRKSNDERLRAEKDFADSILDIQNYINDKRVELLQEGIQKEKEEIEKGYRDELERINKLRDKAISEYNEKNSLKGNKAITSNNYKEEIPELSKGIEDAAAMAMAKKINKLSELNRQAIEEVQQVIDETDEIFKSNLENQTAQINKAYEKRKKIIIKNVEDIEEQTRLLASLEEKREKETAIVTIENSLKSLDVKKDIELKKQELINKTFLFQADREKALLEIEKNSKTTRLELLQELKEKGIQGLEDEIELLKVEIQGLNNELEKTPTKKIQEALKGISSIANAFSGLDGEIGEVFSSLGSAVDSISASFENAKSETKDYYGSISTAISGIVDIINMVSAASAKRKQVEKEFYQNQIALAHEYALAINETLLAQSQGTGFVTDYAGQINDAFASMTDATDNYHKALEKLNDGKAKIDLKNAIDWGNVGKGAASGAIAGAAIGSIVPVIGTAVGAVVGGIVGGLVGLFGGKKKKNVMDGLLEVFPELVDSAGNLNKELAQTLINTNQVDDSTKQLIQNAIDWADAVEAANEQIKGIVVDLAGDLGGNIRNALVDAWKAGEDASKRMFEAASESLGKFVQDLVYSAIFSDIFKQFEDDLTASLNPETGDQDVVDDYDRLMNALDGRDEFYLATMEAINKRAAERGLDFKNTEEESTQQSSRGGFETMSQDKAEEMVGRLTGMHITGIESLEEVRLIGIGVEEIRKFNLISAEKLTEMRDIALTSTDYLGKITKNTNELYEMNDRLGKIENHLRKL